MEIRNLNDLLKALVTISIFIITLGLCLYSIACMLEDKPLYAFISFIGFIFMLPISQFLINKLNSVL